MTLQFRYSFACQDISSSSVWGSLVEIWIYNCSSSWTELECGSHLASFAIHYLLVTSFPLPDFLTKSYLFPSCNSMMMTMKINRKGSCGSSSRVERTTWSILVCYSTNVLKGILMNPLCGNNNEEKEFVAKVLFCTECRWQYSEQALQW